MNAFYQFFLPKNLDINEVPLARLLINILVSLLGLTLVLIVALILDNENEALTIVAWLAVGIVLTLAITKLGYLQISRYILTTMALVATSMVVLQVGDGIKDVQIVAYPIVILLGTLLLGKRGAIIYTVLSIISFAAIWYVQRNALIPYELPERISYIDLSATIILFIMIAVIQTATFSSLLENIDKARDNEETLKGVVTELEQTKVNLEQRVAERTQQLQVANAVSRAAGSVLDPDEIIHEVVTLITDKFKYYYSAIFLVDENYLWAELRDATGEAGKALLARNHRLQIGGQSMVGSAIAERRGKIALDVGDEPIRLNNPLLPKTRSEIALPLIAGNQVLGALDVQSTQESAFNEDSIDILQNMANQVAVSLENARLFQISQERLAQLNRLFTRSLRTDIHTVSFEGNAVTINPDSATALEPGMLTETQTKVRNENGTSIASVPILIGNKPFGVIQIEVEGREWTNEEIGIFDAVATQAAGRLENLQLIEESQKRARLEQITNEITSKIRENFYMESILLSATESIREKFDLPEVVIQLAPPEIGS